MQMHMILSDKFLEIEFLSEKNVHMFEVLAVDMEYIGSVRPLKLTVPLVKGVVYHPETSPVPSVIFHFNP